MTTRAETLEVIHTDQETLELIHTDQEILEVILMDLKTTITTIKSELLA